MHYLDSSSNKAFNHGSSTIWNQNKSVMTLTSKLKTNNRTLTSTITTKACLYNFEVISKRQCLCKTMISKLLPNFQSVFELCHITRTLLGFSLQWLRKSQNFPMMHLSMRLRTNLRSFQRQSFNRIKETRTSSSLGVIFQILMLNTSKHTMGLSKVFSLLNSLSHSLRIWRTSFTSQRNCPGFYMQIVTNMN